MPGNRPQGAERNMWLMMLVLLQRLDMQTTFHILDDEDKLRLRTFLNHYFPALRNAPWRAEISIRQLREPLTFSWKAKMILHIVAAGHSRS